MPVRRLAHGACSRCGLLFAATVPSPERLAAVYREVYREGDLHQAHLNELALLKRTGRAKIGHYRGKVFLNRYPPASGDRLLEIGCGVGIFLAAAARKGWQVQGIDLSDSALAASRSVHGLPVQLGTIESVPLARASTGRSCAGRCWNTCPIRGDSWSRRRSLLRRDGLLACSVPNAGPRASAAARAGPGGAAADPPEFLELRLLAGFLRAERISTAAPGGSAQHALGNGLPKAAAAFPCQPAWSAARDARGPALVRRGDAGLTRKSRRRAGRPGHPIGAVRELMSGQG